LRSDGSYHTIGWFDGKKILNEKSIIKIEIENDGQYYFAILNCTPTDVGGIWSGMLDTLEIPVRLGCRTMIGYDTYSINIGDPSIFSRPDGEFIVTIKETGKEIK
jgi:hypothetical protein